MPGTPIRTAIITCALIPILEKWAIRARRLLRQDGSQPAFLLFLPSRLEEHSPKPGQTVAAQSIHFSFSSSREILTFSSGGCV